MNLDQLKLDITKSEARRLYAYKDSKGLWTGGIGHLLDQGCLWDGVRFSDAQVDLWLGVDIETAVKASNALLEWPSLDTDSRQNALVELVFNMGPSRWRGFVKCRQALQAQNWGRAAAELLDSKWFSDVQPHGLKEPGRASRIMHYIQAGTF